MKKNLYGASIDDLASLVTKRNRDLFAIDVENNRAEISDCLNGARVLLIGGAGCIGSATLKELLRFRPKSVHVVDSNENSLVEIVRDLRSSGVLSNIDEFLTLPIDYGSEVMARFLSQVRPYSLVLNFAALKHVRSEKNVFSLLQMFNTNILKQVSLMTWLAKWHKGCRLFCVSTDKAANPVNFMGASKRILEQVIFSHKVVPEFNGRSTSARFANVAFSAGSLFEGFLYRFRNRQPLACPEGIKRFFVTPKESGLVCLLAAVCCKDGCFLIPRLDAKADLQELAAITERIIGYFGFEPAIYLNEEDARSNFSSDWSRGRYPLLLTKPDTSGEKAFEEFLGFGELGLDAGWADALEVKYLDPPELSINDFLGNLNSAINDPNFTVTKEKLHSWVTSVIPQFRHVETGKDLDSRM